MQKIQIIGNLGADAEVKTFSDGKQYDSFRVAVSQKTQQGEQTTWYDCLREHSAVADYLKKGQKIYAEGTPRARAYQNRDGETVASIGIRVYQLELLGPRQEQEQPVQAEPVRPQSIKETVMQRQAAKQQAAGMYDNDLPF